MLGNFHLFLPLSTLLELPSPVLSSPISQTLPNFWKGLILGVSFENVQSVRGVSLQCSVFWVGETLFVFVILLQPPSLILWQWKIGKSRDSNPYGRYEGHIKAWSRKGGEGEGVHFKNSYRQGGVQFSYEIILGGYSFHTPHFSENPRPPWDVINDRSLILQYFYQIVL